MKDRRRWVSSFLCIFLRNCSRLNRFLVIDPLKVPLRPTLGIQLAPPAVGLVAYLSVTEGEPGLFAQMLFGYALLQSLILLRLLPWIREQKFAPSYWAFTFGISALSLGALRLIERGALSPAAELAPILFIAANLVIGGIAVGSIVLLMRGRLLQPIVSKDTARQSFERQKPDSSSFNFREKSNG